MNGIMDKPCEHCGHSHKAYPNRAAECNKAQLKAKTEECERLEKELNEMKKMVDELNNYES